MPEDEMEGNLFTALLLDPNLAVEEVGCEILATPRQAERVIRVCDGWEERPETMA